MQLSPSELPKRSDLAAWLQERQAQLQVTKTTKTPSGQTIDWIPVGSQTPQAIATPPPSASTPNVAAVDPQRPTKGVVPEIASRDPRGMCRFCVQTSARCPIRRAWSSSSPSAAG
jgi:hypothetical protein